MSPPTPGPAPAEPSFTSPVVAGPVPPGTHPVEPSHRVQGEPLATTPPAPPVPAALLKSRPRHGDPATRRVARALRRLTGASVAREVERTARVAEALQQPVTTGRQIAVTGIRGGAGKTTVTALLGRTYAHFRQDPVLMLEADAALGTLPARLGAPDVRWTCGDLARIITPSMQLTDVTGYLVQLPGRGWLLPGSQGRVGARLELAEYRAVMLALRRYFGITVVDCDSLPSELSRTALVAAQARVLVTPATAEGMAATRAVLDWMVTLRRGGMLRRTVVVVTEGTPHTAIDFSVAREALGVDGVSVRALPYDRHLAAGGVVRSELLARRTHDEVTELAADVLTRSLTGGAGGGLPS
ncbi:type VII secretion protein [Streptomyces sp. CA-181903]|uniref:MinD/ParA family ATP-binding protein n=1 Tax=Streptomyces sp. CA-181903 TaxID=3240055 RepID=UPI003D8D358A